MHSNYSYQNIHFLLILLHNSIPAEPFSPIKCHEFATFFQENVCDIEKKNTFT